MRKVFIISLILLGVVLFFLGVYNFAFKKNDPTPAVQVPAEQTAQSKSALPPVVEKIAAISSQAVLGVTYDKKSDSLLYYTAKDGTVWKTDADGKSKQQISDVAVAGLKNVLWSSDRSKVLTVVGSGGTDNFYEYDYSTKKATALKEGLDTAVWDNLGGKIYYKYYDPKTKSRTLNVSSPDGSGWQKLADIDMRNLSIAQIPLSALVAFWNYPTAGEETKLQTVGIAGGNAQIIFQGKFGADYLWSPKGNLALVSSLASQGGKQITMGNLNLDGAYNDLNIPTMASKCVWSADGKTIYYALPGGIPDSAIMPDDYQNNKFTTKDTFWKMDITTGQRDRIIEPAEAAVEYDSINLFLSPTEDALYFVNKIDKKLYKISL